MVTEHELRHVAALFHPETTVSLISSVRGEYIAQLGAVNLCTGSADKIGRALYKTFKTALRDEERKLAEQEARVLEGRRRLAAMRALVKGTEE